MSEILQFLKTDKNPGLDGPLIDSEGFPRSDIDVFAVRKARYEYHCLINDLENISKTLSVAVTKYFQGTNQALQQTAEAIPTPSSSTSTEHTEPNSKKSSQTMTSSVHSSTSCSSSSSSIYIPIFRIKSILDNSPADQAGLEPNDLVIQFGTLNSQNLANDIFPSVVQVINSVRAQSTAQSNAHVPINITRNNKNLHLKLYIPPNGSIGMHFESVQ